MLVLKFFLYAFVLRFILHIRWQNKRTWSSVIHRYLISFISDANRNYKNCLIFKYAILIRVNILCPHYESWFTLIENFEILIRVYSEVNEIQRFQEIKQSHLVESSRLCYNLIIQFFNLYLIILFIYVLLTKN